MFDVHSFFSSLDIGHSDLDIPRSATHFVMWQDEGYEYEMYDEFGNPIQNDGKDPFPNAGPVMALTRKVDPDPNGKYVITDYIYDDAGNLIETIDGRGISSTTTYDSRGRAIEQVAAAGTPVAAKTETDYDANGNVIEVRSPRYFDVNDTNGYQNAKSVMTYNGRNRLASRTEAPGTAEASTESYTYTVDGRLDTRTDARGNDWQTIYHACCGRTQATIDPLGHGTITNNDYRGNVTHQATVSDVASHTNYHNPDDTKTLGEVTTRYDERNRPIARTTWLVPLGVVDPNNVPIAGLAGVPSSDGLTQRWFYDDDLDDGQGLDAGITVAKIDGSGSFTLSIASLLTELSADGTDLGATGSASADGSATVTLNGEDEISVSISDGAGRSVAQGILEQSGTAITWSTIQHDTIVNVANFGDVLETARHDALNHITRSRTDGAGRTIESVDAENFVSTFSSDANGNQIAVRDPNSVGQDCTYDALNRDIQCADTLELANNWNRKKAYDVAGNLVKETDAKNHDTLHAYDSRSRRVSTTDRLGGMTIRAYDAGGNLLSLTDPENQTTSYTYDSANRKLSEAYPDHVPGTSPPDLGYGIVSFTYDGAGRVSTKTDQQGDYVTFVYDLAYRLISREYRERLKQPTDPANDTDTFTHNQSNQLLTAVSDRYNNTIAFTYDSAARKATESLTIGGQTYQVGTSYDAVSRLTQYTYPDGTIVERMYTPRGLLQQVKVAGTPVDTRTYDDGGRMLTSSYNNGVSETRSYNTDNTLLGIAFSGAAIGDLGYTWDANKNKTAESITGVMSGYGFAVGPNGYDAKDRLINWSRSDSQLNQQWALSPVGDWNTFTETASSQSRTHGLAHELLSSNAGNATHDAKGNMTFIPASLRSSSSLPTSGSSLSLSWDFDNKMQSADVDSDNTPDVFYHFDALGRRVARQSISEDSFTIFVQCDQQTVADYAHGAPPASPTYLYTYAIYLDQLTTRHTTSTGETLYYHRNQQYSIYGLTDATGTIVERYAYTAYGSPMFFDEYGSQFSESHTLNRYTFTGREWDSRLFMFHFRRRVYSSTCGAFASRDPIGYLGGTLNLYQYVHSKPLRLVDPMGLADSVPGGELPGGDNEENVFCTWEQMERFICKRNCYNRKDFPATQIKTGCIGITAALIGHYPRISQGDFRYCFDKLDQAITKQKALKKKGYCKGKDSCGNPAEPVIFAYTWNRAKCLKDRPVDKPAEICDECGQFIWHDEVPQRCWIWDFGFYLEGPGVFCHANEGQSTGGLPEISTCFGFEEYERKYPGHETIYCVTCEGDGKDGYTNPTVPQYVR